jgi:septal ring factor EnvC (AmiA/AmiB activator)
MVRRLCLLLFLPAALLASLGLPLLAQGSARERDLAEIRRQVARLEGELRDARARERTLAERLAAAELDLNLQERRVAEAAAARELAEERVARSERAVGELEAELAAVRASLRRRLTGLYRLGRNGPLRLVLAAEPGSDLPAAVRLLRYLVRRDAVAVERYVGTREQLLGERRVLEGERREVERWLAEAEGRRAQLAAARRRQAQLLARARADRAELAERTEGLQDKERKLSALLDSLYGRAETPLSGRPMEEFQGVLDWPVEGRVELGFGPRTDPRYRTEIPHNGIDVAPEEQPGRVRAVYPGEVLYAAPFEGYGRTVVLHHAGRVFTLYAGLDELLVERGDVLELGAAVGTASGRVYFEIRKENRPEDPLRWLR